MRAKRVDGNHEKIVAGLRAAGYSCWSTAPLGRGFPDLVVGSNEYCCLLEVKDPSQPPSARKLTPDEERFHKEWKGPVFVVETLEECLSIMKLQLLKGE
jgi:hypothetical protein